MRGYPPKGTAQAQSGMAEKVIPLADHRYAASTPRIPSVLVPPSGRLGDRLGRPLRDLRISVTDQIGRAHV